LPNRIRKQAKSQNNKVTGNTTCLSILTLNVSGLQSKDIDWYVGLKTKHNHFLPARNLHLTDKDKHWLRVKRWNNIFQENGI
jgi:hypothetical protein